MRRPQEIAEAAALELTSTQGALLRQLGAVALGVGMLAASARVAIRVPISPVPVTMQTLAVLLMGGLYGSRLGAGTVVTYLLCGLAGLPVFASGVGGPVVLLGPTAGYLVGFVLAAYLAGRFQEIGRGRLAWVCAGMLAAAYVILLCGAAWLIVFLGGDAKKALVGGVLPFLAGDTVKAALAAALCSALYRPAQRVLHPHHHNHDADA